MEPTTSSSEKKRRENREKAEKRRERKVQQAADQAQACNVFQDTAQLNLSRDAPSLLSLAFSLLLERELSSSSVTSNIALNLQPEVALV